MALVHHNLSWGTDSRYQWFRELSSTLWWGTTTTKTNICWDAGNDGLRLWFINTSDSSTPEFNLLHEEEINIVEEEMVDAENPVQILRTNHQVQPPLNIRVLKLKLLLLLSEPTPNNIIEKTLRIIFKLLGIGWLIGSWMMLKKSIVKWGLPMSDIR